VSRRTSAPEGQRRCTVRTDDGAALTIVLDGPDPRTAPTTLLLAHGWTLTHHSWDDVVALVREQHPELAVVRWDQRDHGRSSGGRAGLGLSIHRLGDDLATVLAATRPSGRLVLGGHSMGSMTVMAWAADRPEEVAERTDGFLLVSAAAQLGEARTRWLALSMRALHRAPHAVRLPRMPPRYGRRGAWGPLVSNETILAAGRREGWVRARAVGGWYGALMQHDMRHALELMATRRVHVVVGDEDRLTPTHRADYILAQTPGATGEVVPGAGHMLLVEHPDRVAEHIHQLLEPL